MVSVETRDYYFFILDPLKDEQGIEGLILGGTELPLILKDAQYDGIPFLNTTQIHVKHAVEVLLS